MSEQKVKMKPVTSSNVKAVGYSDKRSTLFVRFAGNALYKYEGVTREVYDELLISPSVGSFISKQIVKGGYTYAKTNDGELGEGYEKKEQPKRDTSKRVMFLIDFSWLYYRSRYAQKELSTIVDGVKYGTGTIHGVYETLSSIFHYHPNAEVLLCMDGVPMKQKMLNPDYKGDREYAKEMTEAQLSKWDVAKPFSLIPKVRIAYADDMEADETIAFYTQTKGQYDEYDEVVVFSSDGDLRQLMSNEQSIYCATEIDDQGVKYQDEKYMYDYGPKGLEKLEPRAVAMYLAITGDESDNIKGVYRFTKSLAKMIAMECSTPDQLKAFLETRATAAGKHQKDFQKLLDNMSLIEKNYALTKIDPLSIPKIIPTYKDVSLDFFDRYECVKAKAGIQRMQKEQA